MNSRISRPTALDLLETLRPIRPDRRALATSQDRISEKAFLGSIGLPRRPSIRVLTRDDLTAAIAGGRHFPRS